MTAGPLPQKVSAEMDDQNPPDQIPDQKTS